MQEEEFTNQPDKTELTEIPENTEKVEPTQKPEIPTKKKNIFARLWNKATESIRRFFDALKERENEIEHAKLKRVIALVVFGLIVLLTVVFYFTLGKQIVEISKDQDAFKQKLENVNMPIFTTVFVAIRTLQGMAKIIPGSAVEIAGGLVYGTWWGLVWCTVGTMFSTLFIMLLGRKYGTKLVGLFVDPEKLQNYTSEEAKEKWNYTVFMMYFIPFAPKDMFSWVASLTEKHPIKFVLITTLIRMPSTIVATWCGNEFASGSKWLSVVIFALFFLVGVFGGKVYKKIKIKLRNKHKIDE